MKNKNKIKIIQKIEVTGSCPIFQKLQNEFFVLLWVKRDVNLKGLQLYATM
jgi:hypothetical protein